MGKHVVDMVEEAALNAAFDAGVYAAVDIISTFEDELGTPMVDRIVLEVAKLTMEEDSN